MKAIHFSEYGSPDVLKLNDVVPPAPKEGEVVVRIFAAAANPLDWHIMRGEPFLARLEVGWNRPQNPRLGADFAGRVEGVGPHVKRFKPGDEVFGEVFRTGLGAFAEYVCVPETALAHKPAELSFEAAAAVPIAALTALQGLRHGHIQAGTNVLINGASGGVGTFAVQIAKALGAEVTGVCSTRNIEMVRHIGADHVIDYKKDVFTRIGRQYDLIYDTVGNHSVGDLKRALRPGGQAVIIGFTSLSRVFEHMVIGPLRSIASSKKVGMMGTVRPNAEDLRYLRDLLATEKVSPVIDRCFPLKETAAAIRYLETGRARGKVIIRMV